MLKNNFIQNNTLVGLTSSSDGVDTQPAGVSNFMKKILIESGSKFGKLTVIERNFCKEPKGMKYYCKCDCGKFISVASINLRVGKTKSCGCLKSEGLHHFTTPEYAVWSAMKQRCNHPLNESYKNYGGRGIKVCDRWNESFTNFITDMGIRPSKSHSLDRIDNNGSYEPGNCRWATRDIQNNNTRFNRHITYKGETKNITQWALELGIRPVLISQRLSRGWGEEKSLMKELKKKK